MNAFSTPGDVRQNISHVAQIIRGTKQRVVLSGAGISTPSGIPDFRSSGSGLWNRYDPFEVASLRAFSYHPEKFFAWFRPLATTICAALPNPAHQALARLEQAGYIQVIITQNIDGLHQRAGASQVVEVHGSIRTLTCVHCFRQFTANGFIEPYLKRGDIPRCPDCHNILKPDAILFEEQLPLQAWQKATAACKGCDFMLIAGSSLEVMPVAGLPMQALENGARLVIVNQSPTYLDVRAEVLFQADVAEILPLIALEVMGD